MEALLFQFMGLLVDWLGAYSPTTLWQEKGHLLAGMAALLIFSIVWSFVGVNGALTNATRGVSNAFALEFPPINARPKLKFLPR